MPQIKLNCDDKLYKQLERMAAIAGTDVGGILAMAVLLTEALQNQALQGFTEIQVHRDNGDFCRMGKPQY